MRKYLTSPYAPFTVGTLAAVVGLISTGGRHPWLSAVLVLLWLIHAALAVHIIRLRRRARLDAR